VHGRNWCQRHANSVKWVHARDGSIYEIGRQALLDDRSPNLVATLVDDLNAEVTAHLAAVFQRHKHVQIVTDAHIRTAQIPKGRVEHTPTGPIVLNEGSEAAWAGLAWARRPAPSCSCCSAVSDRFAVAGAAGDGAGRFAGVGAAVQIRGALVIFDPLTGWLAWLCRLGKCPGRTL